MYWTCGAGGSRLERSGGPPAGIVSGSRRMVIAFVVVTLVNILFNAIESVANFMKADWVKKNSHAVGVPDSWLPFLGAVKGAAAVGLAVGLFWRPLGIAAAIGLVVFFVLGDGPAYPPPRLPQLRGTAAVPRAQRRRALADGRRLRAAGGTRQVGVPPAWWVSIWSC